MRMKVEVNYINSGIPEKDYPIVNKFISFLQEKYPLNNDLKIIFLGERTNNMTTGSRNSKHVIKVLSKNRIKRDIFRTMAHEWVHEYECDVLDIKHTRDIGGKNENIANAESGIAIKTFEKLYPKFEPKLYQ
jgi:hypothetical protein